jgi:hypothetical protein
MRRLSHTNSKDWVHETALSHKHQGLGPWVHETALSLSRHIKDWVHATALSHALIGRPSLEAWERRAGEGPMNVIRGALTVLERRVFQE